jgi:DNA adenine methylase
VHECYVEPFGGGASVLLRKQPSPVEVYNDLDHRVVRFFRVLRERAEDLVRAIELTPYSRQESREARQGLDTEDDLEAARRFYVAAVQGRGGAVSQWSRGWRYHRTVAQDNSYDSIREWNTIDHLYAVARRLKSVYIECEPALTVIGRFDGADTLFYVDPPYVQASVSRSARKSYSHEMDDQAHRELAEALHRIKGMAVVSGYESTLYEELFSGWELVRWKQRDGVGRDKVECLWLSPAAVARGTQPRLF